MRIRKRGVALSLAIIIGLLISSAAYAHSGLSESSPKKSEVVMNPLKEIRLTFNTAIEADSRIEVQNEAGQSVPMKQELGKESMAGLLEEPLPDGKYTVNWTIIGEDTHSVKGNYSFVVDLPEQPALDATSTVDPSTEPAPDQPQPAEGVQSIDTATESVQPTDAASSSSESASVSGVPTESTSSSNYPLDSKSWIGIAILVICLAIGSFGIRSIVKRNQQ